MIAFFSISRPQLAIGPSLGESPNSGINASASIDLLSPSLIVYVIEFKNPLPFIAVTSAGVISFIIPLFFRS